MNVLMPIRAAGPLRRLSGALLILCCGLAAAACAPPPNYGLSDKTYAYIVRESDRGGRLDFSAKLKEDIPYQHQGQFYSRADMRILMWAKAIHRLGVNNLDTAVALYQDIFGLKLGPEAIRAMAVGLEREHELD